MSRTEEALNRTHPQQDTQVEKKKSVGPVNNQLRSTPSFKGVQRASANSYLARRAKNQLKKPKYSSSHVKDSGLLMSEKEPGTSTNPEIEMKLNHEFYLRAVNNPLRRKILQALTEGNATVEELEVKTSLDEITLRWHLNVLESGLCVEKENKQEKIVYKLTKYGKVVKYLE